MTGTMVQAVESAVLIPQKVALEGRPFEGNTKEEALRKLVTSEFSNPVYMPEIIDGRNEYGPEESPQNWLWLHAPSIKATGRTKAGTPLVVYAHVTNYFSDPDNIAETVKKGLVKGAGIMPSEEFYRLVDLAEEQKGKGNQRVFLVDYNALGKAPSGLVNVKEALKHPQTIPFIGSRARAEAYLPRHEQFLGKQIGIWHIDDLAEKPVGRVLNVGNNIYYGLGANYSLYDNYSLNGNARFVGVRSFGAEGAAPQTASPLEVLVGKARDAGNGVLILHRSEIGDAAYRMLTAHNQR